MSDITNLVNKHDTRVPNPNEKKKKPNRPLTKPAGAARKKPTLFNNSTAGRWGRLHRHQRRKKGAHPSTGKKKSRRKGEAGDWCGCVDNNDGDSPSSSSLPRRNWTHHPREDAAAAAGGSVLCPPRKPSGNTTYLG